MRDIRVGVIGVGSLGYHHARISREVGGAKMAGIFDSDSTRLSKVAKELEVRAFDDVDDLLDNVDACVIAVPTTAHEEVACKAVRRGIHTLIEKPIAPTIEAADRILQAAQQGGAIVQIGHVERFNAALRACEPYLDSPMFVECHRLAPFNPRGTDVAVVLDLMIHDLDLVLSLMKRPVTAIGAVGVPVLTSSPDIANARLEFEGGGVANLTASRVSLERMRKIRLFQRSGYISIDLSNGTGSFLRVKKGIEWEPGMPFPAERLDEIVERITLQGDEREPLRAELENFVGALRGEVEVAVTGHEGRDALAVALEIIGRIERYVQARASA
ncbi:MAG TPA: Gfo/Idh/MocA family oxidoreductase [Longimicrobiales bacterium]|nr:Gfo/Idh/MocA family oxidoreductase [Longimicrobiales bacterium]